MSKFNVRPSGLVVPAPIVSAPSPTARTYNQAPAFERDPQSELFLLAVGGFVTENTFYEKNILRDTRFKALIHEVAKTDPSWMARFLIWLRTEANMRTASIVGAVEFAVARLKLPSVPAYELPGATDDRGVTRYTLDKVCQRADEPGEALAYYMATYGRKICKPVKRGIADAASRLYNERNTLKYDTASHGVRFGDVLELTHPAPDHLYQHVLFKHLIDRRHGRGHESYQGLNIILKNIWLRSQVQIYGKTQVLLSPEALAEAAMTWEDALSLAGDKVPKNELWEAMIPNMGYMALLRNLRNFDEAGISAKAAEYVAGRLADPDQVVRSRQLPMRFLSAYRAVSNLRWSSPLEQALNESLLNVPSFPGRTLILIDTSGSMANSFSQHSDLRLWDAAAIFGLALAQRCEEATVVSFSYGSKVFGVPRGESLLRSLDRFKTGYFLNGGTNTALAVRTHYQGHDRVICLTDEQSNVHSGSSVFDIVPKDKIVTTFNLAGYRYGHAPSGSATRNTIAGLSDNAFKLLPVLEQRASGGWPF